MIIDKKAVCLVCEELHLESVMSHDRWTLTDGQDRLGFVREVAVVEGWLCPECNDDENVDDKIYAMLENSLDK